MSIENHSTRPEIREVPCHSGFGVSADGSAWTRYRVGSRSEFGEDWRLLHQTIDGTGYPGFSIMVDGKPRRFRVHALVLELFVGPRPKGCECLHGDGSKTNNDVSNLRWGTRSENMKDAVRHGTHVKPANSGRRDMTEEQVRQIPLLRARGMTQKQVGEILGVHQTNISQIERGKTWGHLE